jgi:threonine aldolase
MDHAQNEQYALASDNTAGVDLRILAAMHDINVGTAFAYGEDEVSKAINSIYSEIFGKKKASLFIPVL